MTKLNHFNKLNKEILLNSGVAVGMGMGLAQYQMGFSTARNKIAEGGVQDSVL